MRDLKSDLAIRLKRHGPGALVYGGQSYDALAQPVRRSEARELVPEGSQNAAFADLQEITVCAGVAAEKSLFAENAPCTFQGRAYLIIAVPPAGLAYGVAVSQTLIVTRAPQPDAATADPATHLRPVLSPAANPF